MINCQRNRLRQIWNCKMPFLIGTDEAGYGPNLGPLVITGTLWKVPSIEADLFELLACAIASSATPERITVCDSKNLYSSSGSIKALESSVLSLLGCVPSDWKQLVSRIGCPHETRDEEFWLCGSALDLPLKADSEKVKQLAAKFVAACEKSTVELVSVRTRTIFADQFNQSIADQGNKANVLTSATLGIVNELKMLTDPDEPLRIVCDKHGGRSKYAGILQHHLTDQLISVHEESLETSRYGWREPEREVSVEFNARGESSMPVALSSMVSKYVREVYMKLWNQFWLAHIPTLKPTKGYPQDAKRFMHDIEPVRTKLNISRESLWRCR